jgi:hypothetical protein
MASYLRPVLTPAHSLGKYELMFPKLVMSGTVLLQRFVGPLAISGWPCIEKEFVTAIRKFKNSNHSADRKETAKGTYFVNIITSLAFVAGDLSKLALNDDTYF